MESSRSNEAIEEGFTPWQVSRLRTRLSHYREAKRQGWERIATDILFEEDLPEAYVDSEEVRPLSESLRRLISGSQTPSPQRLHAVKIFLISQNYLNDHDLDDVSKNMVAPLAFAEFAGTDEFDAEENHENGSLVALLPGRYLHINQRTDIVYRQTLQIESRQNSVSSRLVIGRYNNPAGRLDLEANPHLRKRALRSEEIFEGWATTTHGGHTVFFLKDKAYGQEIRSVILMALELKEDANAPTKLLMLPYRGAAKIESFEEAYPAVADNAAMSIIELEMKNIEKLLTVFEHVDDQP